MSDSLNALLEELRRTTAMDALNVLKVMLGGVTLGDVHGAEKKELSDAIAKATKIGVIAILNRDNLLHALDGNEDFSDDTVLEGAAD